MKKLDWANILSFGGRIFWCDTHLYKYVFGDSYSKRRVVNGLSAGQSYDTYDITLDKWEQHGDNFWLGSSVEKFRMPKTYKAIVHDKSSLIRKGLLVGNSVIEREWQGYLTLEMFNFGQGVKFEHKMPICAIGFVKVNFWFFKMFMKGYNGKYQNQPAKPVSSMREN